MQQILNSHRRNKKCKACFSTHKLCFHHTKYATKQDPRERGITLCSDCHNMLHRFIRGSNDDIEMFTNNFVSGKKFWKDKITKLG